MSDQVNPLDVQQSTFTSELAEAVATVVVGFGGIVMVPVLGATADVVRELRRIMGPKVACDVRVVGDQPWLRFEPPYPTD